MIQALNFAGELVPAVGSSGGLISCWDPSAICVEEVIKEFNYILISTRIPPLNCPVVLVNIYYPNSESERRTLLEGLSVVLLSRGGAFCVEGGVFNGTLNLGERKGGVDETDTNLCNFIESLNLIDFPLANGEFIWFSSRGGGMCSRFDCPLREDLVHEVEGVNHSTTHWGLSDHRQIPKRMHWKRGALLILDLFII